MNTFSSRGTFCATFNFQNIAKLSWFISGQRVPFHAALVLVRPVSVFHWRKSVMIYFKRRRRKIRAKLEILILINSNYPLRCTGILSNHWLWMFFIGKMPSGLLNLPRNIINTIYAFLDVTSLLRMREVGCLRLFYAALERTWIWQVNLFVYATLKKRSYQKPILGMFCVGPECLWICTRATVEDSRIWVFIQQRMMICLIRYFGKIRSEQDSSISGHRWTVYSGLSNGKSETFCIVEAMCQ